MHGVAGLLRQGLHMCVDDTQSLWVFWCRERNELEQNCLEARQDLEAMKVSLQQVCAGGCGPQRCARDAMLV